MKKAILAILALGSFTAAQAQAPSAGSILLYGDLGISVNKQKNFTSMSTPRMDTTDATKSLSWNVSPGIGYQLDDHWTVGLNLSYANTITKPQATSFGQDKRSQIDFTGGLFVRCTKTFGNTFFVYNQLNVSYQGGSDKATFKPNVGNEVEVKDVYSGFSAFWYPAVGVTIMEGFALNFSFGGLGYSHTKWDYDVAAPITEQTTTNNSLAFTFGQQINIGVSKNFGGSHHKMHGRHEPMDETRRMNTNDDEDTAPKKKKTSSDDDE